ncbi:MAG: hypothetical protein QM770_17515 [Tepidisphaeraceae bacterium]
MLYDVNGRIVVRAKLSEFGPIDGIDSAEMARRFDILFPETDSHLELTLDSVRDRRPGWPNKLSFDVGPVLKGAEKVIDLDRAEPDGLSKR